ncbi:MAG: alpha/beta hydrolase [Chthoniobacterales bacterium]
MTAWLWLAVAVVFAGISLLAVFRARTLPQFFLAVGATEFGHFFALLAVVFAVASAGHCIAAAVVLAISAVMFASPTARALRAVGKIRTAFKQCLGAFPSQPLIRFGALWRPGIFHNPPCEKHMIEGPGGELGVDFYRATGSAPAPLVVLVHGGGWMAGDSRELAGWNRWLARRGYAVAVVEYRLMPTGAWPSQREDVLAAVEYLRGNAAGFGVDRERVVFFGRSAGGQIASAIAAAGEHPWLRGCVCLYSPFDMVFAYEHGSDDDMLRSRWLLRCHLGGRPEERMETFRDASAYLTANKTAPPFLLMHGTRDELVWVLQSRRFAQRLSELGVPNALIELPWATHAFDFNMSGPGGQITASCLDAFLRRVCGSNGG